MSNSNSNDRRDTEPEITAQPRSVSDEIALAASAEADLSVDPDDLGARFLRDAIEEGNFAPERAAFEDASLMEVPSGDAARVSPNFAPTNTVWEQTIDLAVRTGGAASELRSPAAEAGHEWSDGALRMTEPRVHEASLLDREGDEGDETVAPDIDTDETGRHARVTPRGELGARVETRSNQAYPSSLRERAAPSLGGVLRRLAGYLHHLADRIHPRTPAPGHAAPARRGPAKMDESSIPHLPIG